jgi:hypothetical protein
MGNCKDLNIQGQTVGRDFVLFCSQVKPHDKNIIYNVKQTLYATILICIIIIENIALVNIKLH